MFSYKILEWEKLSRQVPRYDDGDKMQDLTVDLSNKEASSTSSAADETAFCKEPRALEENFAQLVAQLRRQE